jgi:HTH-type transcriptional repressor of NAD biosynthesis genes
MPDSQNKTQGLLLGKFLPPHRGHQYLIDFARQYADHLTVHVCSIPREPIPGHLRFGWMREQWAGCENVTVVHCDDLNPQVPEDDPENFWEIWRNSLLSRMDRAPDFVFASEPYGFKLAETVGAIYIPVDHAREIVPVSGTRLRSDPLQYWQYLLPPARPHFARRIALVGPESSGKSTLTTRLAAHFGSGYAPEYARGYLETVPAHWIGGEGENGFNEAALITILRGQRASVEAVARQSETGIVFSDTEAIVTACWSQVLLGYVPEIAESFIAQQEYDLYLVQTASEFWVNDSSQRVQPDYESRKAFEAACTSRLEQQGFPYVCLRGTWEEREGQAIEAVENTLGL